MLNRRDFLRTIGAAGLAAAGSKPLLARADVAPPNILLLITDQSRAPVWYPPGFSNVLQTRDYLARRGVQFRDFYVNSIPSSPNRASTFTGLHAHQHWILDNCQTGLSLDTGFPNIGSMLHDRGYETRYFGKWFLTNSDQWHPGTPPSAVLRPYGFDEWQPQPGLIARDYDGGPNQGYKLDDDITRAVVEWLNSTDVNAQQAPWFAVASLINPHDASWYPRFTRDLIARLKADGLWVDYGVDVPGNYESMSQLIQSKPSCQAIFQTQRAQDITGVISRLYGVPSWTELLNYYLWLQARVDAQLGQIVLALRARPPILANTVVIYVSDHGELGASHGLRGKGPWMYEEQNHIPCIISDFSGRFMPPEQAGAEHYGFASSVDLVPSMLELAGVPASAYPYLPGTSLVPALANPGLAGEPFVLASEDYYMVPNAPCRVIHYHDEHWKISLYNNWVEGTDLPDPQGEEAELYDLTTPDGRIELDNIAGAAPQFQELRSNLMDVYRTEMLAAPLPGELGVVQQRARTAYLAAHLRAPKTVLDNC